VPAQRTFFLCVGQRNDIIVTLKEMIMQDTDSLQASQALETFFRSSTLTAEGRFLFACGRFPSPSFAGGWARGEHECECDMFHVQAWLGNGSQEVSAHMETAETRIANPEGWHGFVVNHSSKSFTISEVDWRAKKRGWRGNACKQAKKTRKRSFVNTSPNLTRKPSRTYSRSPSHSYVA